MMKCRLLTYSILLFLCFINVKALANTETSEQSSLTTNISMENSDQPIDQIHLNSTDVNVNINGSIAEVTVRQQFKNNSNHIINGRYTFPAPDMALVHGMQMKTNEEIFKASVKEHKTAQEEYTRFKDEGKNALLLKQDRPNLFSMNMANVMPGETVDIELNYTELLIPTDMKYEFAYPIASDPEYIDQTEAEFNIEVNISAGIPIKEIMCMTHDIDTILNNESSAKVILKDSGKTGHIGDYILNYRLAKQKMPSGLILSGGEDEKFLLLNDYITSPGVKNVSVKFTDLKTYDLEPLNIPGPYARRPVTLLGKWKGEADGFIKVQGRLNRRDYSKTYRIVKNRTRNTNGALKQLWAGQRIGRLTDFSSDNGNRDIKSEITTLGLNYDILTDYTSLIAYNDVIRKRVIPVEDEKELLPLQEEDKKPEPVRIAKVPEPGFYVLLLILTSVVFTGNVRRKAVKIFSRRAG